ncbi:DUF2752 domain-containing protein [Aeromicrobium sp. 9AM]|uniref:DUF2752 domain-containing protein n=1 Tax=Aeromicrobium sp. 9AM TaxID=2653126 RepID=UPI0012EFD821|nr:DUF2752 domain-containing protein [Aeromicrobium sp. 9AM]VXC00441.1 conserved membrane hypothetical protein [Aeromicrobium sp. 9AM]
MTLTPRLDDERRVSAATLRAPALVGAAGLGEAVLLHLHDPHDSGSYGYCPFLQLTGKPCPGCGGLRAVNDLTRGDFIGAASSNVLAVALVAGLAVAWLLWFARRLRGKVDGMVTLSTNMGFVLIGVLVVFGILRNTPWGSWLAP